MMETIRCPYCDCKVLMSDVETDDGTCPECGAPLMGSSLFDDELDEDAEFGDRGAGHGFNDDDEDDGLHGDAE